MAGLLYRVYVILYYSFHWLSDESVKAIKIVFLIL